MKVLKDYMKILILTKTMLGGIGAVVNSIKPELEKRGHKVIVVSRNEDLKIYSSVKNLLFLRQEYKNIIKIEKPDIIYTQDWSMALPLIFPFNIYKNKHYCCFHGNQPGKTRFIQKIVSTLLGKKLFVVGDSLKKRFPDATLVYNGVDLSKFKPNEKIKKIKDSVGFVNLKTKEYHYEEIESACKNLKKKFIAAENIPYEKMPEFYQKLDCFISLPPKGAGFNMSWIEAMGCGVSKIIGNEEGIGKILEIDKIDEKETIENVIQRSKSKKYREIIESKGLNWKSHVNKLLDKWKNENTFCRDN